MVLFNLLFLFSKLKTPLDEIQLDDILGKNYRTELSPMIGGVDIRDDQDWLNKLSNESDSGDLKIDLLFSKLFKLIRKLKERNNMDDLQQRTKKQICYVQELC